MNHEMGFYIGKEHSESPPEPSNADVFISERKPMTVFTRYNLLDMFLGDKFENLMWLQESWRLPERSKVERRG